MFSGIVRGKGSVRAVERRGGDLELAVDTAGVELGAIGIGDSIAVNGVCLTATVVTPAAFHADVSAETLARTTLGRLRAGDAVNLEPSLRLGQTIDGHLVYGHVDGVGEVVGLAAAARSLALTVRVPAELGRYIAVKGSVTVDGVSLTVNAVERDRFTANIIPHTREITNISGYAAGTPVNIEVDMIARYLERLMTSGSSGLDLATLKRHGFIESD